MNTFVIGSFISEYEVHFLKQDWPLHVTIVPPFRTAESPSRLATLLKSACSEKYRLEVITKSKELFGINHDIPVMELENTPEFRSLYESLMRAFIPIAQFVGDQFDFKPHVTKQKNDCLEVGQSVSIKTLYLVQYDGQGRTVICLCDLK